jgi:hypothetical protein
MKISKYWLLVAVVAPAVALVGTRVLADDAVDIETYAVNAAVTYDGNGDDIYGGNDADVIVDQIMSAPGTYGISNKVYSSWAVLAADASGSVDVFGYVSSPASWPAGYTPTVGDNVSLQGTFSPYHGIPEIGSPTSFSLLSQGNAQWKGGSQVTTISQALANPNTHDALTVTGPFAQNLDGYLVEIQNVTISGQGVTTTFPTTNKTMYLNDTNGKQLTLYFWYSSYSCDAAMTGAPIPGNNGLAPIVVDVYGLLTSYPSVSSGTTNWQDELIPTAFVGIPEPSSFMLAGIGLLSLIAALRRRHS